MNQPDKSAAGKTVPKSRQSRLEEALRFIEEYADDLRKLIEKLRRRLH